MKKWILAVFVVAALAVAQTSGRFGAGNFIATIGGIFGWIDTGLSRDSAGVVDVGNGTAGNKSGTIDLATVNASSTLVAGVTANGTLIYPTSACGSDSSVCNWNLNNVTGDISTQGHFIPELGSAPVVSTCGGGTLVAGSADNAFAITGITAATSCTVTFHSAISVPTCTANTSSLASPIAINSISASAVTFGMTTLTGSIYATCF